MINEVVILESKDKDAFKNPESLKLTEDLQKELAQLPLVGDTFSLTDFITRMNSKLISLNNFLVHSRFIIINS